MKRVQRASGLLFLLMIACGGSSSETPMPLEPVPHTGPEPKSKVVEAPAPVVEEESSPENSPLEDHDESETPAALSPDESDTSAPSSSPSSPDESDTSAASSPDESDAPAASNPDE